MMPLRWIEQAEARQVCVIAISERRPMPNPQNAASSLRSSLVRLRSWIAPSDQDRDGDQETPYLSTAMVRLSRTQPTEN
jgi:hypothetical protein